MIDNRINYHLVLDTETTNGLFDPLVYDIGGMVVDKQGRIYEHFSYTIRDIFVYEKELMASAYYATKIPEYIDEIRAAKRETVDFMVAWKRIKELMRRYNIKTVAAYNAHFDRNALNKTIRYITKSRFRYFFPYETKYICIWNMACQVICSKPSYKRFCEEQKYFSNINKKTGEPRNYSTKAEIVYQYLTLNPDFQEVHRGIDDVEIEVKIMVACYKMHKAFPKGKSIRRNCWMDVKREVVNT